MLAAESDDLGIGRMIDRFRTKHHGGTGRLQMMQERRLHLLLNRFAGGARRLNSYAGRH